MNLSDIRKTFLWSFIGFLSLTAIVGVFSVLTSGFGDTQIKVLATTFTVSAASICAMSCAAFFEKGRAKNLGLIGILFAGIAALLTIVGIWGEISEEPYWKTTISLIVVSVALAHAFLLLMPGLKENHQWIRKSAIIFIAILALQIIFAVWSESDDEWYYRVMAVISIGVVLMTLLVPICSKLGAKEDKPPACLVLQKISEGVYTDQSGRKLLVTELETGKAV
jgi:peptidoglycan/LPS O-acetylase OafA/YrhL